MIVRWPPLGAAMARPAWTLMCLLSRVWHGLVWCGVARVVVREKGASPAEVAGTKRYFVECTPAASPQDRQRGIISFATIAKYQRNLCRM